MLRRVPKYLGKVRWGAGGRKEESSVEERGGGERDGGMERE
jgi:hypothetical protein